MNNQITALYKAYANTIVGTWYNEMPDEVLVFSFLYNYTQESDLLIIEGSKCTETTYSIQIKMDEKWYLIIWNEQSTKPTTYFIEVLSPDMLVLKAKDGSVRIYLRKIDHAFVHRTLKKLM